MAEDNSLVQTKTPQSQQNTQVSQISQTETAENLGNINRDFQEKSVLRKAHELKIPYVNIGKTPLNPDFLKILDIETERKARLIPFFKVAKKLRVAVEDPAKTETLQALDLLKEKGFEVSTSLASSAGIDEALAIYEKEEKYKKIELTEKVEESSIKTYEKEIGVLKDLTTELEKVTAEEGLNMLNIGAMKTGASDAHYEPEEDTVVVRFRIDGILHKVFEINKEIYKNLARQIKYKGKLSLNVTTIPQDGRYDFSYNDRKVDVRVSSIPTPYGEGFVCRYLRSGGLSVSLAELGFQDLGLKKLQNAASISHGMILTTGPTGSGKTTTLYALLNLLNTSENKIITLEDPVEYHLKGVSQSQIDEKHGYTFANGLRSILRQDPDVVMIGEIRDLETAETAASAALTGHILLSTLHTNSAIESIPRLINMGLPPFMIAPALYTIIGQRLVRKVCDKCVTLEPPSASELKEFSDVNIKAPEKVPHAHGCPECSQTGYKGRMVIAEVITINEEMKNLILNNASLADLILAARKEGFTTMREDGLNKIAQGLTTMEEVYRTTNINL